MIKKLFPLLITACLFCGCSKVQEFTIYGTVFYYDGTPVQAAKITVSGGGRTIAQTVSGSDGAYEVSFNVDLGHYTQWCGHVKANRGESEEFCIDKSTQSRIQIDMIIGR